MIVMLVVAKPAHAQSKVRAGQRWYLDVALNANLPTGKLNYPAVFNPDWEPYHKPVTGGYTTTSSLSYALKAGYEAALTKNGMHGITAGLWFCKFQETLKGDDYSFTYHGATIVQNYESLVTYHYQTGIHLGYIFRIDRLSIQLLALWNLRDDYRQRINWRDGLIANSNPLIPPYEFNRWLPCAQMGYVFLDRDKIELAGFVAGIKQPDHGTETKWWNVQVGIQVATVGGRQLKNR